MSRYVAPSAWPTLTLGELTERTRPICYGVLKPGKPDDNGVPLIRVTDISTNRFDDSNLMQITPALDDEFRRSRLNGGELLLSIQGTIGRVAICPHEYAGANISRTIAVVEPDDRVDRPFSYWFLRFLGETNAFHTVGTTRSSLNIETLRMVPVPVPPIPEQRRIAEILDKADTLRAKRRAALAQLDTLSQSIFLDMFGDHSIILKQWPINMLGELLDFLTSGSRGWAKYYAESGDLFLRIQNVGRDELLLNEITYVNPPDIAEAKRTRVQPGDVLLSITADLGRAAVVPEGIGTAFINQHLSILRTKALIPRFLSAYFASPVGQRQVLGRNRQGVKAGLNFDDIRSFIVPLPPIELQREFARRVQVVEKMKTAQRATLAEMNALFTSLQYRAFRGEL